MKLITVLPDTVKSAKLTAEWENELTKIAKGEKKANEFMRGIEDMVSSLVKTYHEVSGEKRSIFGPAKELLGKCPRCGCDVIPGKFGAYCTRKCGMVVNKAMGQRLDDEQIKSLLKGERILLKGLKGKKGKEYGAYLTPKGISDFHFTNKDGREISGFQYDFEMDFPENRN